MESKNQIYESPIRLFEKEIIEFFVENIDIMNYDSNSKIVYSYFLIHHKLTKEKLIVLTGFNLNSIESSLKILIKMGCITIAPNENYDVDDFQIMPISIAYINKLMINQQGCKKWLPRFKQIKQKLINNSKNINLLDGYFAIYTWVVKILRMMPVSSPGINDFYVDYKNVMDDQTVYLPFYRYFLI